MNSVTIILFTIISLVALFAAVTVAVVVLRRVSGVKSERKAKSATPMPDDEHKGRDAIVRQLTRYASMQEYKVVEPVNLVGVHGTTDLDALLVGWFGVLGVKCLGYGGDIYGSLDQEEWSQTLNGKRRNFQNPMTRAQKSSLVIRDVLFEAGIKNVPVETAVVFTGKNPQLMLPRSTGHYTPATFTAYLKSIHFEEDKNVQVEPVAKLFRERSAQ